MDPQQELFTKIKTDLEKLGYTVYDGAMPPEGTAYPFLYLGEFQQIDSEKKNAVTGSVFATIHVWHNTPRQRGSVSQILLDIKTVCRKIEHTNNFNWFVKNVNQRIITDDSTKTPLLHGYVDVEFMFS